MRSLQQYVAGIEFPAVDDRAWIDGPFIGLSTVKEAIAPLPPVYRREDAESAVAHSEITVIEAVEATKALVGIWSDYADWRGPKP